MSHFNNCKIWFNQINEKLCSQHADGPTPAYANVFRKQIYSNHSKRVAFLFHQDRSAIKFVMALCMYILQRYTSTLMAPPF